MGSFDKLTIANCQFVKDDSGHEVFHVKSPHAMMQAVGYLKHTAEPWDRIFLRGQSQLYDNLPPSLYRGITTASAQGKRHQKLDSVVKEFVSTNELFEKVPDYAREPLLQHYGIKTTWLDIVDNIWIALWFAINRANTSGTEKQYMHFDVRRPDVDGEFGYIILIRTEDSRKEKVKSGLLKGRTTETIDLRTAAPSVFLRPHAQHGLLFRSRGTEGGRLTDYSDSIAGIIRFSLEEGIDWLGNGAMHNVRSLFPPPFFDNGYQILLGTAVRERSIGLITYISS